MAALTGDREYLLLVTQLWITVMDRDPLPVLCLLSPCRLLPCRKDQYLGSLTTSHHLACLPSILLMAHVSNSALPW